MPQSFTPRAPHLSALDRYFEVSLYLLLLTSVLALVSTGKLDLFTMLAAPAALVIKGIRWLRRLKPELSARADRRRLSPFFSHRPLVGLARHRRRRTKSRSDGRAARRDSSHALRNDRAPL
jgi:hypothetical protein